MNIQVNIIKCIDYGGITSNNLRNLEDWTFFKQIFCYCYIFTEVILDDKQKVDIFLALILSGVATSNEKIPVSCLNATRDGKRCQKGTKVKEKLKATADQWIISHR